MLDQALEKTPNDSRLLFSKVDVLIRMRDFEAAKAICNDQLRIAPTQTVHDKGDMMYSHPRSLEVSKGNWFAKRAEVEYAVDKFEEALKDCESSLGLYTRRDRPRVLFLKSKILNAMSQKDDARKSFEEGAYLLASESGQDKYAQVNWMKDAALAIGLRHDPIKESPNAFIAAYGTEHVKPRTEHAEELVDKLYELARLKAPTSVAQFENLLCMKPSEQSTTAAGLFAFFAPNQKWQSGVFVKNNSDFSRAELNLQPDVLYSSVTSENIIAKFGAPHRQEGQIYVSHSDPTVLRYITPDCELSFTFSHSGFKSLKNVQFLWNDDAYKAAIAKAKADHDKRELDAGKESAMIVQNVQTLTRSKMPKVDFVEKLFSHRLQPLRQTAPCSWSLGYQNWNYNGVVDVDYALTFAPGGQTDSSAQLRLRPGMESHKVLQKQIEELFSCTVISTTDVEQKRFSPTLMRLSHKGNFGSLTAVCDSNSPGSPVEEILIWWRGANTATTLEEYEKDQTVDAIVRAAESAISQRNFEGARFLLDSAFARLGTTGPELNESTFDKLSQIRSGYLKLFTALNCGKEMSYLRKVSCTQLMSDLRSPDDLSAYDGKYFPTSDKIKGRWCVRRNQAGCSLEARRIGILMARNEADEAALRTLYSSGSDGSKVLEFPPAYLIDSIYFDLNPAKKPSAGNSVRMN